MDDFKEEMDRYSLAFCQAAFKLFNEDPPKATTILLRAACIISGEAPKEYSEEVLKLWQAAYFALVKKFDSPSTSIDNNKETE